MHAKIRVDWFQLIGNLRHWHGEAGENRKREAIGMETQGQRGGGRNGGTQGETGDVAYLIP